jgi:hypothetical protein
MSRGSNPNKKKRTAVVAKFGPKKRKKEAARKRAEEKRSLGDVVGSKRKRAKDEDEDDDEEGEVEVFEGKSRRIRIFPTKEQKMLIKRWIGTARWTYNQCNAAIRDGVCQAKAKPLRALFVNEGGVLAPPIKRVTPKSRRRWRRKRREAATEGKLDWVLDTPYYVRNRAVAEIVQAYSNARKKHGAGSSAASVCARKRSR